MPDVYDIGRHQEYLERQKWNKFYDDSGKGIFKSMSAGPYVLNKDKNVFGNRPALGPEKKKWHYKGVEHENKWKPSNPHKAGK